MKLKKETNMCSVSQRYTYIPILDLIRYSITKGEEATLATFGVGFCSQEDTKDCILFVNLLDNAILPIPTCGSDGSISWPECKISPYVKEMM